MDNFNLIPWDTEAYLVAADYAEENGCLLPKAIRDKDLPLDYCRNDDCHDINDTDGYGYGDGEGEGSIYCGWGNGSGWGNGNGYG